MEKSPVGLPIEEYPLATCIKEIHLKPKHLALVRKHVSEGPSPLFAYTPTNEKSAMNIAAIAIVFGAKAIPIEDPDMFCLACSKGDCAK
jgi:hypothetical protein